MQVNKDICVHICHCHSVRLLDMLHIIIIILLLLLLLSIFGFILYYIFMYTQYFDFMEDKVHCKRVVE